MKKYKTNVLDGLEDIYFDGSSQCSDIRVISTDRSVEKIIEDKLKNGTIDEVVLAWKMGTLKYDGNKECHIEVKMNEDGNHMDRYGRQVSGLCEYIDRVIDVWNNKRLDQFIGKDGFKKIYAELLDCEPPDNFGTVYIISLVYFLSKGKWPLFDKYARIGLEAIYQANEPYNIIIVPKDIPTKYEVNRVVNTYNDYCEKMTKVFGNQDICRKIDRELWVYGHKKNTNKNKEGMI